jgi:dethiobiotin synthetase
MESIDSISPWRFSAPLSPHRAAALEQKTLDVDALVKWSRARITGDGLTLIEGAGGVMVPLTNSYTSLDWMAELGLPIILVTGSYLGSISHTLTALDALRSRNLALHALVMSETEGSTVTLDEAIAGLTPFIADIPLRIVQPRVSSWREATAIHALEL